MVPLKETALNSRLKIVRLRTEQNFKKYFTDLCEKGDANGDGDIDLNEWLDVMDSIIGNLRETDVFPEWYEGLHKALFLDNSPAPTKYALARLGLCTEEIRLPLAPTADAVKPAIDRAMDEAGVA